MKQQQTQTVNHKTVMRHKFRQAGVTLMELIASLAVMAVVVTGAIALYSSASTSERSTSMSRDLTAIQSAAKTIFSGQGTYGAAGTNLNDTLVVAKKVPTTISVDTGSTPNVLTHQANGTTNIVSTGSSFSITLTNMDPELCVPMMTGASGWTSVQVGTAAARTAFPVAPATAAADCATGTTMVFTN